MRPKLRWPIDTVHHKCQSSLYVFIDEVAVERDGKLVVKCDCRDCNEEFVLVFSVLELCAEAALSDRDTLGSIQDLPGIWTAYAKPN